MRYFEDFQMGDTFCPWKSEADLLNDKTDN